MREQKKATSSFCDFKEEFLDEMIPPLILERRIKDRVGTASSLREQKA